VRELRVNSAVSFREDVLDLGDGGLYRYRPFWCLVLVV
jgi:hypothetical protein